jgi:hypothetical protein
VADGSRRIPGGQVRCYHGSGELFGSGAPQRISEATNGDGYSYDAWTPLMLSFESLFGDAEAPSGKDAMKREFTDVTCERLLVREFLYPTGGYAERSWNWGGNSRTTAALLFQDAWDYFERNMKPA